MCVGGAWGKSTSLAKHRMLLLFFLSPCFFFSVLFFFGGYASWIEALPPPPPPSAFAPFCHTPYDSSIQTRALLVQHPHTPFPPPLPSVISGPYLAGSSYGFVRLKHKAKTKKFKRHDVSTSPPPLSNQLIPSFYHHNKNARQEKGRQLSSQQHYTFFSARANTQCPPCRSRAQRRPPRAPTP